MNIDMLLQIAADAVGDRVAVGSRSGGGRMYVNLRRARAVAAGGRGDVGVRGELAVADAAVVGVPDDEWGEAVAVATVFAEGANASEPEPQAWVRERLRSTRCPERIEVRRELPDNETGELLRVLTLELAGTR